MEPGNHLEVVPSRVWLLPIRERAIRAVDLQIIYARESAYIALLNGLMADDASLLVSGGLMAL